MLNQFPLWKNLLLLGAVLLSFIYAVPNLFGHDPAVQISGTGVAKVTPEIKTQIEDLLKKNNISYAADKLSGNDMIIRFNSTDTQILAKDTLQQALGDNFVVALNLISATPNWLSAIGAEPMKLGLDLRGGIHLTLEVDIQSVLTQRAIGMVRNLGTELRQANVRYTDIQAQKDNAIIIKFRDQATLDKATTLIKKSFPEYEITHEPLQLTLKQNLQNIEEIRQATMDQTMTTLRNRVNELGIAEAIVQQQGATRISVDLPGIQDAARAQEILGGTATLDFRMVDQEHDAQLAQQSGSIPAGSTLYTYEDRPYLLKNQVLLTGNSITDANAGFGEDGRATVNVRLGGGGEATFYRTTGQNVGKLMSVVYIETKLDNKMIDGTPTKVRRKVERLINVAVIKNALPANFQISGLADPVEARNLALLLRAGALPANIDIIEQRVLGPKLGLQNIKQGMLSVAIGLAILIIFVTAYYRLFGLIANIGLFLNLLVLIAVLSMLGMTLTMSGIAGIVLTIGMAIDANVLIFERIREELRNGMSAQASIHAGYERAFTTIIDSNVTTLLVALVLFGIGTGTVKGFAVTLSIGILASMFTAITLTRAMVNAIYGGRNVQHLSIGI